MKDFSKLKMALDLAREFESERVNSGLEEGVKKTTKLLLFKKPDTSFEEIVASLILSARDSCYKSIIQSEDLELSVNMFMSLIEMMSEGEEFEENEEIILREIIRYQIVNNMMRQSFNVSMRAASEVWNNR